MLQKKLQRKDHKASKSGSLNSNPDGPDSKASTECMSNWSKNLEYYDSSKNNDDYLLDT